MHNDFRALQFCAFNLPSLKEHVLKSHFTRRVDRANIREKICVQGNEYGGNIPSFLWLIFELTIMKTLKEYFPAFSGDMKR